MKRFLRFFAVLTAVLLLPCPPAAKAAAQRADGEAVACAATLSLPFDDEETGAPAESGQSGCVRTLIPGGMPFGLRVATAGVLVVGTGTVTAGGKPRSPAADAGLCAGDLVTAVNGKAVARAEDVTRAVTGCEGKPVTLTVRRGSEYRDVSLSPCRGDADGEYRCGLWLRDRISGIGTVTFYEPESGLFGGLGHGICAAESGQPVPIGRGSILSVAVTGVARGVSGKPGELHGSFSGKRLGSLCVNCEKGVFGVLSDAPESKYGALPVADAREIADGDATILCTLGDDGIGEYTVRIRRVFGAGGTRSLSVTVTDENLLARTGGIVQGMSGSPILQNGRIVGAVTHVLIDDPTTGYGIMIGDMLAAMNMRAVA